MDEWLADRGQDVLTRLDADQYLFLPIIIGTESAGFPWPVPAEFVMALIGYQVFRGQADPVIAVAISAGSATVGASILYWVSRVVGRPLLLRYGRLLRIAPAHIHRLERWFDAHAAPVVVVGRVIPAVRILIPIVAGVARGNFGLFVVSVAAGNVLWSALYLGLGWGLGGEFEAILSAAIDHLALAIGVAAAVAALLAVLIGVRRRGWPIRLLRR